MVNKIDKNLFIARLKASNPKMTDTQANSLWFVYESTGTLPKEFASLLQSKDSAKAPSCVFKPSESTTNYSLGVEISAPQTKAPQEPRRLTEQEKKQAFDFSKAIITQELGQAQHLLENYYGSNGAASAAFYFEKIHEGLKWAADKTGLPMTMPTKDHIADLQVTSSIIKNSFGSDYKSKLKEFGISYNEAAVLELQKYREKHPDLKSDDKKYRELMGKAFGSKLNNLQENVLSQINYKQTTSGVADAAIMLYSLGTAAEAKGVAAASQAALKTFGKVGGSVVIGGGSLAAYTAATGSINNLTKASETTTQDWKNLAQGTAESFGFGAFGGLLGATVIPKVINGVSKTSSKAINAVTNALDKEVPMSGKDVMRTFLTNQTPTSLGKAAGFGVEIAGFTGYEVALDVVKDICSPNGRLPENMTVDQLSAYLGEKFKNQGKSLGEIRVISSFLMMHKGGALAQKAVVDNMLNETKMLDKVSIKQVSVDGKAQYEITMPDGNIKKVSSPQEIIEACNFVIQPQAAKKAPQSSKVTSFGQNIKAGSNKTQVDSNSLKYAPQEPQAVKINQIDHPVAPKRTAFAEDNGFVYEKSNIPFVKDKVTFEGKQIATTKTELVNQICEFYPKEKFYKKMFNSEIKDQNYSQEHLNEVSKALHVVNKNVINSKEFLDKFRDELLTRPKDQIERFSKNLALVAQDGLNVSDNNFYDKKALGEILFERNTDKIFDDIQIRNSYKRCSDQDFSILNTRLVYDKHGIAEETKELTNLLSQSVKDQMPENALYNFNSTTNYYKHSNLDESMLFSKNEIKTLAENVNIAASKTNELPNKFLDRILGKPKRYLEIVESEKNITNPNIQKKSHSPESVITLLNIEREKWAKVKERGLLNQSELGREFSDGDIVDLADIQDSDFEKAVQRGLLNNIEGRKNQLTESEIRRLNALTPEEWSSIEQSDWLKDIPGRSKPLSGQDIVNLCKSDVYPGSSIANKIEARGLFKDIEGRADLFGMSDLKILGAMHDTTWQKVLDRGLLNDVKGRSIQFNAHEIRNMSNYINDEQWQNVLKRGLLNNINDRPVQLSGQDVIDLSALSDVEWQRVLDRGLLKKMDNLSKPLLTGASAAQLATLDDSRFEGFLNVMSGLRENKLDVPGMLGGLAIQNINLLIKNNKKFIESFNEALAKKNQLKSGIEDISDSDIRECFQSHYFEINEALEILDKPTFVHSYSSKLSGVEELAQKCGNFTERCMSPENYELLLQKFNPENSQRYAQLQTEIAALKKSFPEVQKQGKETLDNLKNEINSKTADLRQLQKGVDLDPQSKISKIRALAAIAGGEDDAMFIDLIKAKTPENEKAWNVAINKKVFDSLGLEYSEQLSQRLNLSENKYLPEILSGDERFKENFKSLVNLVKENPNKSVAEVLNELPQNQQTKEMFGDIGVNYDKWVNADKNSFVPIEVRTSADAAKQAAIEGLEAEFNDHAFLALPKEETDKIINTLKENGIELKEMEETKFDENGYENGRVKVLRFYSQDKPVDFSQVEKINSLIKKEINSNDFWTKKMPNSQMDAYRETMYSHLVKDRDVQIKNAAALKSDDVAELEIRKTDMNNIQHALFLGNHGSCCTAVGTGGNQFSAPTYIKNKMISAIEVVDGKDFVGNTMCYIAEVDGKPSLVLDNIELNAKYQKNDKIREAMFAYARKMTEEIGKPDMPIYAGPYRHKLNMEHLQKSEHEVNLIGSTGEDKIYLDFITSGRVVDGSHTDKVELYKIR